MKNIIFSSEELEDVVLEWDRNFREIKANILNPTTESEVSLPNFKGDINFLFYKLSMENFYSERLNTQSLIIINDCLLNRRETVYNKNDFLIGFGVSGLSFHMGISCELDKAKKIYLYYIYLERRFNGYSFCDDNQNIILPTLTNENLKLVIESFERKDGNRELYSLNTLYNRIYTYYKLSIYFKNSKSKYTVNSWKLT